MPGLGLGFSRPTPPVRKKFSSCLVSVLLANMMVVHRMKEKRSLSFSNSELQRTGS